MLAHDQLMPKRFIHSDRCLRVRVCIKVVGCLYAQGKFVYVYHYTALQISTRLRVALRVLRVWELCMDAQLFSINTKYNPYSHLVCPLM
jgi:hypothetical protein